jgi:hypothetical protein
VGQDGYESNLPYGPTQVNQPLSGAAEGGGSGLVGAAGADSRRQAKLMLAWGFLLVGVALLLRSVLEPPSPPPPTLRRMAAAPTLRWRPKKKLTRAKVGAQVGRRTSRCMDE